MENSEYNTFSVPTKKNLEILQIITKSDNVLFLAFLLTLH